MTTCPQASARTQMGCTPELPTTMGFNLTTRDIKSVKLPAKRLDWILLQATYTVTDTGITNGETLSGAIELCEIGEAGNRHITAKRDELLNLCTFLHGDESSGVFADETPTTATAQRAYFLLEGPFQLSGMDEPEVQIQLNPVLEWGGATAFVGNIDVLYAISDDQYGDGYNIHRSESNSATQHTLSMGTGKTEDILVVTNVDANVNKISIESNDGSIFVKYDKPTLLNTWFRIKHATSLTIQGYANLGGMFELENVDVPAYPGRRLVVQCNSTDSAVAFYRNHVSG